MLGVSRNTVYGMVNAGELPTIRFGKSGMIRIPIAAVEKLIADAMESDKRSA
jgi:excisionase family DNA binding protein